LPASCTLLVLVRNILVAREAMYGVREWASRYAPDLLNLWPDELGRLGDDRLGRDLDRMFEHCGPPFLLAVVGHAVQEFQVSLDELHNDSTTVSFQGAYLDAEKEGMRHGRPTHAITWGHSKDHRPDLKQLLYTLTISDDGSVPVYFTSASGNVVDDQTHQQTWDLLRQLVGHADFLYVADCKLASTDNMNYIARQGGRFVSVLPRTRKEDRQFRHRLKEDPSAVSWQHLYDLQDEQGCLTDRLSTCADEAISAEGFRLLWYHSTKKAELDAAARARCVQRAVAELSALRDRLQGSRTRFREQTQVQTAVEEILRKFEVEPWVMVHIEPHEQAEYRQAQRGRPTPQTRYVKHVKRRYTLSWQINGQALAEAQADDGVFPLISNDPCLNAVALLRAYKRQPMIEKRFSQLKTNYVLAPVYLKSVSRIQGLLAVYFLALLVQALLERELRRAMAENDIASLPLYPEGRPCARPTTARVMEVFEPIQRHELTLANGEQQIMVTELSTVQRKILRLLKLPADSYGLD
jgi:transposase